MNKFIKHFTTILFIASSSLFASNGAGGQLNQEDLEEVTINLDESQNTPPPTKEREVSLGWAAMLRRNQNKHENKEEEIVQEAQKQNINLKAKFFKYRYHLGVCFVCILFVIFVIKKCVSFFTRKKKEQKKLTLINSAWKTFGKIKNTILKEV
jgi:hypothetical protein